jgi:type III secretion system YscQ/HrcQ family protein
VAALTPFSWTSLPRVSRAEAEATTRARRLLGSAVAPAHLAFAASTLLRVPVEITKHEASLSSWLPMPSGVRLHLVAPSVDADVTLDLEPSLATRIAATVLEEPLAWIDPAKAPPPEIVGAAGAFAVALARRAGEGVPWRLATSARAEATTHLVVRATIMIDTEVHEARASIPVAGRVPTTPAFDHAALASQGDLPLTLPIVAAELALPRASLADLAVGDALVPGEAWSVERKGASLEGEALLVAPHAEVGLGARVSLGEAPRLVLIAGSAKAPWEPDMPDDERANTAEALADVRVVVRVELGTVTLSAKEWAAVDPGDVLTTGVRVGERVTLRSGGVVIARGELCDLEGELAVRITERSEG